MLEDCGPCLFLRWSDAELLIDAKKDAITHKDATAHKDADVIAAVLLESDAELSIDVKVDNVATTNCLDVIAQPVSKAQEEPGEQQSENACQGAQQTSNVEKESDASYQLTSRWTL